MWLKIVIVVTLPIICFVAYRLMQRKLLQLKQKADLKRVFKDWTGKKPRLKFGSNYGWPTFEVIFKTQNEAQYAIETKMDAFKKCIKSYYGPDFNPDYAVIFTFREWSD